VGLSIDPPDRAVVLCVDEKSRVPALDRTQPTPPMSSMHVEVCFQPNDAVQGSSSQEGRAATGRPWRPEAAL
jgi:hypothetical protein